MGGEFESTIGKADLELGQEYFGSVVRKVKQEVDDTKEKYKIKRMVYLESGMILVEEYWRDKSLGVVESLEYGKAPKPVEKDHTDARAKARALLAARKKSTPQERAAKKAEEEKAEQEAKKQAREERKERERAEEEARNKAEEEAAAEASKPKIHVKHWDGSVTTFTVTLEETVGDIKALYLKEKDMPVDQQRFLFQGDNLGDDAKTLEGSGVENGSTLVLEAMQIHVKITSDKKISLQVEPEDLIEKIQGLIEEKASVAPEDQRLQFKGQDLDDPKKSLASYEVKHEDTLTLDPMKINVQMWDDSIATYEVESTSTIGDIKTKVEAEKKIDQVHIRLSFGGVELKMDTKSLKDYTLNHKDTLVLEPMIITVLTKPENNKFELTVKPHDPIPQLKWKLKKETGIPVDNQILIIDLKDMLDKTKLSDHNVKHGDTLHLRKGVGKLWEKNVSWMSNKAIVFARQNAPPKQRDDDNESRGVWKSKVEKPDDWKPQKVDIYPPTIEIDNDTPNGVWGINPEAMVDDKGQYAPKDLWFYPPGEKPEDDEECVACGKWSYRERQRTERWPPPKKNQRVVGKLPKIWKEYIPPKAVIYPKRTVPKAHSPKDTEKGVARGIWKWSKPEAERPEGSDTWVASDVQMYEDGNEPENWDDSHPSGVWGLSPETSEDKSKPADVWFIPPEETPPEDFIPVGKWRLPPKKTWPPNSVKQLDKSYPEVKKFEKSQNKVGKLAVPAFLQGK